VTHVNGSVRRGLKGARRIRSLELSSRHKRSTTPAILKHDIRENSVAEYFSGAGLEIRPLPRLFVSSLRNDTRDYLVPFSKFYDFAGAEPGFQPTGIAKLA
jgi:hypothetical protein